MVTAMKRRTVTIVAVIALVSTMPGAAAASSGSTASTQANASAYSGTHVSFDTQANAVVDYAVDGETMLQSVAVQSQSQAESDLGLGVDAGLQAVAQMTGAGLSMDKTATASASLSVQSGASVSAHDNTHGSLVVASSGQSQYVEVGLAGSAQTSQESDSRLVVTTENGTKGTFIVVGDGEVTVNDRGNVSASVEQDSRLVFRSYGESRSSADEKQEQLIADGTAAAEVYVMQQGGATVSDTVTYTGDTTVEVTQQAEGSLEMTAERSQSEGRVIITSLSEDAYGSVEDVSVTVDGEAAAQAASYSELRQSTNGGDSSTYMVRQAASASANAQVLVGVSHFSERSVTVTEDGSGSGGGDGSNGDDSDGTTDASGPGFGVLASLVALVGMALLARRRAN
jgi:PGF-CTERM protein